MDFATYSKSAPPKIYVQFYVDLNKVGLCHSSRSISAQFDWVLLKKTMNRDADQADEQTTTDPNVTNRHHSVSKLVNLADRYTIHIR